MKIQVNHIGKMEGHTDFVAEILRGDVKSAKMMTTEGARLIEGILIGRHFSEAPVITPRICGICPVVHKVCSIQAIEQALQVKPSRQTVRLRELMLMAQTIHSHALHLFFLSLPDFFDLENDFDFISGHKKQTESAIAVRDWALKIIEIIGGRAVHPIALEIGGLKAYPAKSDLIGLSDQFETVFGHALKVVSMALSIKIPALDRPTTYVALKSHDHYAFSTGNLAELTADGQIKEIKAEDFTEDISEIQEPYRAAKSAELDGSPFMVGALARLNISRQQLNPLAKGILQKQQWRFPQHNPFYNIIAQAVEVVHCLEEAKSLLDELSKSLHEEPSFEERDRIIAGANPAGRAVYGCAAVEAPRGTLYHSYNIDRDGMITDCQIITPTVSFLKNLEDDIAAFLPDILFMPEAKRAKKIRSLIRAYDPCISCATH